MLCTLAHPNQIPHCCLHTHHPIKLLTLSSSSLHLRKPTKIPPPNFTTGIFYSLSAIDKHQQPHHNHQNQHHDDENFDDYDDKDDFFNRFYDSSPIYLNDTDTNRRKIVEIKGESSSSILSNMWWADLKAAVGQRINVEGLLFSVSVITRNRNWVMPHVSVPDIRYIDWAALKKKGFQGVVFDKDNTLTVPYSLALWGPLGASLESCKSVFGNNIAVFSNSAGNNFD